MEDERLSMRVLREPDPDVELFKALYLRAFPENERRSFDEIFHDVRQATQVLAFYQQERFVGFMVLMEDRTDISYLTFFAVEESCRGEGLGSKMLAELRRSRPGRRIIVDIEIFNPRARNMKQRRKRRAFYLRNGYRPTMVFYRTRKENFQFLVSGGRFTNCDYYGFWKNLGPEEKKE